MRSPIIVKTMNVISIVLTQPSANGLGTDSVCRSFPILEITQSFVRCLKAAVSKLFLKYCSTVVNFDFISPYVLLLCPKTISPLSNISLIAVDFGSYAVSSILPTTLKGSRRCYSIIYSPLKPFPVFTIVCIVQIILTVGRMTKNGTIATIDACSNLRLKRLLSAPSLSDPALSVNCLKLVA